MSESEGKKAEEAVSAPVPGASSPVEGAVAPTVPALWQERVGKFAEKVGKPAADVSAALAPLVGEPSDDGLETLSDTESCPDEDLLDALKPLSIPKARLRKALPLLRGPTVKVETAPAATAAPAPGFSTDVLPHVPDDESFVAVLRAGGTLKVDQNAVLAAIKTALAAKVGLYDLPKALLDAMTAHAEGINEPCSDAYYEVEKLVHSARYAEVLGNISGRIVSERNKNQLLSRLDEHLWSGLRSFQQQLSAWQDAWMAGSANPNIMFAAMAASMGGGVMPPGMMQPPDASPVRDAAEAMNDVMNKVFAGVGIPVARAMAYEAQRVKKVLSDSRLPASIGTPNYEQMLRKLGTAVSADYERLERNVARYALGVMELPKVTAGQQELTYLGAMLQLGLAIQWDRLTGKPDGKKASAPFVRPARREPEPY